MLECEYMFDVHEFYAAFHFRLCFGDRPEMTPGEYGLEMIDDDGRTDFTDRRILYGLKSLSDKKISSTMGGIVDAMRSHVPSCDRCGSRYRKFIEIGMREESEISDMLDDLTGEESLPETGYRGRWPTEEDIDFLGIHVPANDAGQ